jgi:flagellar FliL protein
MADEQIAAIEETPDESAAPKKKGGKKKLLIIVFVLLLMGGGGGFYYWRHRAAAKALIAKEGLAQKSGEQKKGSTSDDGEVKEVIELQPFIVNLADKNESRYLRMTISLGVGESSEEKADILFITRVRNAIVATITNRTSDQILTVEGKAELRKDMLGAARSAVAKPEVHAIYITDFIVQM